jgi:outer membrane protein assembly factor BamB
MRSSNSNCAEPAARAIRMQGGDPAVALFVVCLCLLLVQTAVAADWPQFLGPTGDAKSPETGLLDTFPPAGPRTIWKKQIGTGYSAPSVRGNRLVLHHRVGREEVIDCLAADTGEPQWRHAYPSSYEDPYGYNNGPRCSPLLTTNLCYTFGAEGKLTCVELATGKPVWQRDTAKDFNVPEAFFGVGSTPILEDGLLIVMVGGQPESGVVAFDALTGRTVWQSVGEKNWAGQPMFGWPGDRTVVWSKAWKQASYASPVAATIHGKRHVFCLMRQGLVSLDPKTGAVNFSRWFQAPVNESVNAMNPVVSGDLVFFSAAYYRVGCVALRVKPDGKSFDEVWRSPVGALERHPVTGVPIPPTLELHWMTPVLHEGHLYAFSGRNEPDAIYRCVELATGKLKWTRGERWIKDAATKQPHVFGRGSLILADGKLIGLGEGGLLGLFKPNPADCEEIVRWQVPELHYPCWTAPVLADKRLFLRSEDWLVCLDFAKPAK